MGRGPVVAGRKAVQDAARGKVFAIHAKLIAVAARGGGDPGDNPSLREAMDKARKDSVPKDVIDRAIKRGTGEDKDANEIVEIVYEGYGAGGVGVVARSLTDNKNRTAASIRSHFSKNGGNLGDSGSLTSHVFALQGSINIASERDDIEELILDSGAADYKDQGSGKYAVYCEKNDLNTVKVFFEGQDIDISEYGLEYIPGMEVEVDDFDKALKLITLLEDLAGDEDVEKVWTNGVIDDELTQKVEEHIESHSFKT